MTIEWKNWGEYQTNRIFKGQKSISLFQKFLKTFHCYSSIMNTQVGFIVKILLYSTAFSYLIKYGGQQLTIEPTNALAIAIVLAPSLIIGLILGSQYYKKYL